VIRQRYLWNGEKWVPEQEIDRPKREESFNFIIKGGYNNGLGCKEADKKDKLKQIRDETGRDLVEVGNEVQSSTPKHNNYELSRGDMEQLNGIIDG